MLVINSKTKVFRNVIYTSFTKGVTLICIVVTGSVVARNLTPADYGVVGFAGIIIGFLAHFSDVGVGSAAIRRPTLSQHSLRTAFTLKIVLGSGAFIIAFLAAPYAHHFLEHPATVRVIRVLALNFLISTIGFMPMVMLTREQNYRTLATPAIASAVVRCILAVTLILLGWRYWAVVLADVGATLASGVATQLAKRIPIGLNFDWSDAREYLRFGVPLLGSGILVFVLFNVDNFLIGSTMGSSKLGYYALAFTWGSFVCGFLSDTVHSVLLPAFSLIQDDVAAMRRWYLKTVDLVAFIAVVVNTALLANAQYFLVTFMGKGGDKWVPAVQSLKILCIYGIVRAVTEPLGNCIMARGKTKTLLHANLLAGIVELSLIFLVLRAARIELIAIAVLIAYATQAVVYLPFLRNNLEIGAGAITAQLWPVIPALIGGYWITSLLPASLGSTLITLIARGLFSGSVVAVIHGLCTRFRCFKEAGGMISQNLARVRA
jgi:lipopolysaccharide exporter